jgi:sortase (surface protein transpeptidase)
VSRAAPAVWDRATRVRVLAVTALAGALAGCAWWPSSGGREPVRGARPTRAMAPPTTARSNVTVPQYQPSRPVLAAATPAHLEIPAIGVSTDLVSLGLEPDGTMQVPTDFGKAGWYAGGPRPGESGPAVLVGHVDSTTGPAVFYRLGGLRAGDQVHVARADGSTVRFVIDHVDRFPKPAFPTALVFGPTQGPALRLITCGGAFDETRRSYVENLVAFAVPAPG